MKKLNLKSLTADFVAVILRFHVVLVFVFGLATMAFLELNNKKFDPQFNVWSFFILSVFVSFSVSLLLENTRNKWLRILIFIIPLASVALYCFTFFNHKIEWEMMQYAAIIFTSVLSFYFVLFFRKNTDSSFWIFAEKITQEFIITVIYTSIFQGGLSLAIYAVDMLFDVKIENEVYGNLAIFCYLIVAPIYFLMNIPEREKLYDDTLDYGKFLKILGLYVFLPVLGIYLVILYFYLFKIIIRWELPNGWVTTLVSVLALGGYLAKYLLFPLSDNKLVNFLNRYFSLMLLPLIVLMSVGLARRISDYGLSINRLYVLIFNIWLYGVSIYLFFTQSKHLRWLAISFAALLFISSVGPWSVFAITKRVIEKDLTSLLTTNKLYVNYKLVDNKDNKMMVTDSIAEEISDKISYYYSTYGQDNWRKTFNDNRKSIGQFEIAESLGVDNYKVQKNSKFINVSLSENRVVDIQGYSKMFARLEIDTDTKLIFQNKEFKFEFEKNNLKLSDLKHSKSTVIPISILVSELYKNDENETLINKILIRKVDNYLLLINNISLNYKSDTDFEIRDLNLTILVK